MPLAAPSAVLCLSGGLDSTSLLYHLVAAGCQVTTLSFDYAQKHAYELTCADWQLDYLRRQGFEIGHQRIDLRGFGRGLASALIDEGYRMPLGHYAADTMRQTVVPNRNAIFFSMAAAQALSLAENGKRPVKLSMAVHAGDHAIYPDCRPEFYEAIWQAFVIGNYNSHRIELYLPYLQNDKTSILRDAQRAIDKLGFDFEQIFAHTCTSYLPDARGRAHGMTGSDVERILAFHELGLADPLPYQQPWEDVLHTALELKQQVATRNLDDPE